MKFVLTTQPQDLYVSSLGSRLIPIQSRNNPKLLISLAMGENLSLGTRARLVVYDLDDYLASPLGKKEVQASLDAGPLPGEAQRRVWPWRAQDIGFFDGHLPGRPLPEALRDPPLGEGVLLKVDLKLSGAPGSSAGAPGPGWHWWAVEPRATELAEADGGSGVAVVMWSGPRLRTGKAQLATVGHIRYREADLKKQTATRRRLLLRFVCLQQSAPSVGPGTVFLSNVCRSQTLAPNPLYVATDLLRKERGLEPPGPAPTTPPRALQPDLTGYYEELPLADPLAHERPDFFPPGFLQLNQAGNARVGWYTPYAELDFKPEHAPFRRARFVFRVAPEVDDAGRHWLVWASSTKDVEDPTALLGDAPPSGEPEDEWRVGTLKAETTADGQRIELSLRAPAEGGGTITLEGSFLRVRTAARLPWSVLHELFADQGQAGAKARGRVITEQAEPLPLPIRVQAGKAVSQENAALVSAIQRFADNSDASGSPQRRAALLEISAAIVPLFIDAYSQRPRYAGHHEEQLRACLRTYATWNRITVTVDGDPVTKTAAAWLEDVLAWALDWVLTKDDRYQAAPRQDVYPKLLLADPAWKKSFQGFYLAGVSALGGHTYKLDFTAAKLAPRGKVGLSFSVGGFYLNITRKDGDELVWEQRLLGAFGGIAAGLGIEGGAKKAEGGVPAPSSIELESFFALEAKDFEWAHFRIAEVGGPSGGFPVPGAGLKTTSALFAISVERADGTEIELSGVVSDFFAHNLDLPDVKKYAKDDWFKASLSLFSIGMSFGLLLPALQVKTVTPPDETAPNREARADRTQVDMLSFRVGSSALGSDQLLQLDVRLATYRKLLEEPGYVHCLGYTSPEWRGDKTGEKNLALSQARADAALDAIRAGLGAPEKVLPKDKELKATGFGEDPATNPEKKGPLLDPENPERYVPAQMTKAEFDRRIAAEEGQYPRWRRVDVHLNGVIIVRLRQG